MNVSTTEQVASVSVNPVSVAVSIIENVVSISSNDDVVSISVSEQVVTVEPQVVTVSLTVTENVVSVTVQEGGGILTEADPIFSMSPAASITNADITNLGNLSGINTGDQDISEEALGVILDTRYLKLTGDNDPITGAITINANSPTAFLVEQTGVKSNVLVVDTANSLIGINTAPVALQQMTIVANSATTSVLVVKAAVSQTADLQQWQNSSGTVLTRVFSDGGIRIPNGSSFSTYTAAGGQCPLFRLDASNNLTVGATAQVDTAGFTCFGSFRVTVGSNEGLRVTPTAVIVNNSAVSTIDFTVKGDISTQLLFVDASAEAVIIGSTLAGALTIGAGTAGIDYILKFDGETNDGTITFMEDENRFDFGNSIAPSVDSTNDIGASTLFFRVAYVDRVQFPISSSATSAPFMETSGQTLVLDLNRTADSNQRTFLIKNTGNGDPILSVQEGNGANTISFQHTGSIGKIDSTFGGIQIAKNLKIGEGGAGVDYTITVDGETNDLTITYMEDEDRLDISSDLDVATNIDAGTYSVAGTAGIDATIPIAPVLPATVAGSATFTKGILTAYTAPS